MRYAGSHNFVGRPIDGYEAPHCCWPAGCRGAGRGGARSGARGLHIKAFDCYRPTRAVANFVRWARDLKDTAGKAEFYPECRQAHAVSRRLYRLAVGPFARLDYRSDVGADDGTTGTELDMGTPFDFFSPKSWTGRSDRHARAARQPHAARQRDATPRLSPLRSRNGGTSRCAASRSRILISIFR